MSFSVSGMWQDWKNKQICHIFISGELRIETINKYLQPFRSKVIEMKNACCGGTKSLPLSLKMYNNHTGKFFIQVKVSTLLSSEKESTARQR